MTKFNTRKAFTLVEMSIVVIIVAILITGILKGSSLIRASRIANARSYTAKSVVPEISGLIAWYETSMIDSIDKSEAVDGYNISKWYDNNPSSNIALSKKNTLIKSSSSNLTYVVNGINSIPSLSFVNSGTISLTKFFQGDSVQNTIFIVFRPTIEPSSSAQFLIDSSSSGSASAIGFKNDRISVNAQLSIDTATSTNPAYFQSDSNYVLCAYLNGSSSQFFLNDASSKVGGSFINSGSNPLTGITIGATKNGSSSFTGYISEVIIYNKVLGEQERKDVMNYLSKKYRISVSGT